MRRATAAVGLALVLTGCGADHPEPKAAPSTPASPVAPSVIPAPTSVPTFDPNARIAVGAETPPAEFPGDDEEFLARTRGILEAISADAPASDPLLVTRGREECSLLSGGGAVASKLDSYAGQRDMAENGWNAVLFAAIQTYCPELGPGYFADRADPPQTTPAEKLDLFRYEYRLGIGTEAPLSDARILRLAPRVCRQLKRDPDQLLADLDPAAIRANTADRVTFVTLLAFVVGYCPDNGDPLLALDPDAA